MCIPLHIYLLLIVSPHLVKYDIFSNFGRENVPLLNSLLLADRILPSADYVEKCSSSDIKSKLNQRNDFFFIQFEIEVYYYFLNVSFVAAEQYKYFFYGNHELESLPITNGSLFLNGYIPRYN